MKIILALMLCVLLTSCEGALGVQGAWQGMITKGEWQYSKSEKAIADGAEK